jgi:hypothetical protein
VEEIPPLEDIPEDEVIEDPPEREDIAPNGLRRVSKLGPMTYILEDGTMEQYDTRTKRTNYFLLPKSKDPPQELPKHPMPRKPVATNTGVPPLVKSVTFGATDAASRLWNTVRNNMTSGTRNATT